MAYYLFPPDSKLAALAPSFRTDRVVEDSQDGNPTVLPSEVLRKFHFTFLIRHPRRAIPSYYRCTIPPLAEETGFGAFMPGEAGYAELRRLFDYLKKEEIVGPATAGLPSGPGDRVTITVLDADDLLDRPVEMVEAYCNEVGIDYTPDMLTFGDTDSQQHATEAFQKWKGFHVDALTSSSLVPRSRARVSYLIPPSNLAQPGATWRALLTVVTPAGRRIRPPSKKTSSGATSMAKLARRS